jgi:hypothetical protein
MSDQNPQKDTTESTINQCNMHSVSSRSSPRAVFLFKWQVKSTWRTPELSFWAALLFLLDFPFSPRCNSTLSAKALPHVTCLFPLNTRIFAHGLNRLLWMQHTRETIRFKKISFDRVNLILILNNISRNFTVMLSICPWNKHTRAFLKHVEDKFQPVWFVAALLAYPVWKMNYQTEFNLLYIPYLTYILYLHDKL